MDTFFMPPRTAGPMQFPLHASIPFTFMSESKSSPNSTPTLKYTITADTNTEEKPYLIWIQNYDTATVQTCREAVARALRKMANDRTLLQDQVDMRTFQ